ncbi:hypothetical protein M8320_04100 [Leclercia sp. H6W5]|uniref:hypothetical protein n=1 Tax=Leclercia tamurae TaxID=2926467 RepID=UPI0021CF0FFF|nr:hypothetical protein [Leclercia tamurae]MCU6681195.1 hypothetical protein [Leclercia tamurae]
MKIHFLGLIKTFIVPSLSALLSGCFSVMLIQGTSNNTSLKEWKTDNIIGLSLAQGDEGHKGYVFVG